MIVSTKDIQCPCCYDVNNIEKLRICADFINIVYIHGISVEPVVCKNCGTIFLPKSEFKYVERQIKERGY